MTAPDRDARLLAKARDLYADIFATRDVGETPALRAIARALAAERDEALERVAKYMDETESTAFAIHIRAMKAVTE